MAALLQQMGKPVVLPPTHGGNRVLGVVQAMGWYLLDGMGQKPIHPTQLQSFITSVGIELYPEEFVHALALSRAYCASLAKFSNGKGGNSPYKAPEEA